MSPGLEKNLAGIDPLSEELYQAWVDGRNTLKSVRRSPFQSNRFPEATEQVLSATDTSFEPEFAEIRSIFPSPLKSADLTAFGLAPTFTEVVPTFRIFDPLR